MSAISPGEGHTVFNPLKLGDYGRDLDRLLAIEPPTDNPNLIEARNQGLGRVAGEIAKQVDLAFAAIDNAEAVAASLAHVMSPSATSAYRALRGILPADDPNIQNQASQRMRYVDALWERDVVAGEVLGFTPDADRRARLESILGITVVNEAGQSPVAQPEEAIVGKSQHAADRRRAENVALTDELLGRFYAIDQSQYPRGFRRGDLVAALGIEHYSEGQQSGIIRRLLGSQSYPGHPVRMIGVGKGAGTRYLRTLEETIEESASATAYSESDKSPEEPFTEKEALLLATILSFPSVGSKQGYLVQNELEAVPEEVLEAFGDLDYEHNASRLPEDRALAFEKIAALLDPDEDGQYRKLDAAIKLLGAKGNRREPLLAYFYFQTCRHKSLGDVVRGLLNTDLEIVAKLNLRRRGGGLEDVVTTRVPNGDNSVSPATIAERVAPRPRADR